MYSHPLISPWPPLNFIIGYTFFANCTYPNIIHKLSVIFSPWLASIAHHANSFCDSGKHQCPILPAFTPLCTMSCKTSVRAGHATACTPVLCGRVLVEVAGWQCHLTRTAPLLGDGCLCLAVRLINFAHFSIIQSCTRPATCSKPCPFLAYHLDFRSSPQVVHFRWLIAGMTSGVLHHGNPLWGHLLTLRWSNLFGDSVKRMNEIHHHHYLSLKEFKTMFSFKLVYITDWNSRKAQ